MTTNKDFAEIFEEFAQILDLKNDIRFKIVAYENAAQAINDSSRQVVDIYKEGGIKALEKIHGVGGGIASKIEEYIKTGKMKELVALKKDFPEVELEIMKIPGVGPKTARRIYQEFKIKKFSEVEPKLKKDGLKIFHPKSLENILDGIRIMKGFSGRMLLADAKVDVDMLIEYLKKDKSVKNITAVGSFRRDKETVGDIDIVASSSDSAATIEYFTKFPEFKKIVSCGPSKSSAILVSGLSVDIEILPVEEFGSLLQHFTGSKEHNVALRTFAQLRGMSVSEHGIKILKTGKIETFETEEGVYKQLGLKYIDPDLREDRGEIDAALHDKLPNLVELSDIKGDLHVHSNYSDGTATIEQMVQKAQDLGCEYIAIADHTVSLGIARGLDEKKFKERRKEIEKVQKKFPKIKVLDSCEVNIKPDGSVDLPDELMASFDIVTASVHWSLKQNREDMTQRLLTAIKNPNIDIIGHPTGRVINRREGYEADWDQIFRACAENNVALEINAYPNRLDLTDNLVYDARKYGVKFAISTDSHSVEQLNNMCFGLSVARRGWCEKKDILNTVEFSKI
jgi:DNA polymerase (family 10)